MAADPADILGAPDRLAALAATGLPDSPPEEAFDRVTRLASRMLGASISTVTLVDGERQFFKSQVGLPEPAATARETPLSHSLCAKAMLSGEPLVVHDARLDPRVRGHPAVAELGVLAYAGVPLVTRDGHALGTVCVAEYAPRTWTDEEVEVLRDLAAVAMAEIEWRRAEAALRSTAARFRALVEQAIASIYVLQDGGIIRYVNPRGADILGYPPEYFEEQPRHVLDHVHPDDRAMVAENLRRRISGEVGEAHYTFRMVRPDGTLRYVEVHGRRTELEGKPAIVGVGVDVTGRVRAEAEREAALAARDRFYAMVSHELRTPISSIMLYNDLLLSGVYAPLDPEQREAVERSQRSARHLLELINDLLDLSKLEAGKMESRLEEVELAELVDGVAASVAPMALEHGCVLDVRVAWRPLVITGDARRTRQILLNLLSNALKFGRGRPVEVRCAPAAGGVEVTVTDHGPGIDPDDVPRIFEEFVQLRDDEPALGTGLGLPIARRLARLLGGALEVASQPGRGSTFRLFLPLAPP
ncbi:MAG TPA: ATP-binding protein [Longimicrobiaceae bacterium]|nr:ATP-binding protein [Longimicrobiaceae bacterium]